MFNFCGGKMKSYSKIFFFGVILLFIGAIVEPALYGSKENIELTDKVNDSFEGVNRINSLSEKSHNHNGLRGIIHLLFQSYHKNLGIFPPTSISQISAYEEKEKQGLVEFWALLIGTDHENVMRSNGNYPLYLKYTLCEGGWQEDHIKCLCMDDATYDNIVDGLEWLANNSDSNDIVLFYDLSHGGDSGFYPRDGRFFRYSALDLLFDRINYGGLVVILNGCQSGGAIPYLEDYKRIILTAVKADEYAYSIFSDYIYIGLNGAANLEGGRDIWVSAEELFRFAYKYYHYEAEPPYKGNHPQLSDFYPDDLALTYMDIPSMDEHAFQFKLYAIPNWEDGACGWPISDGWINAQSFVPDYSILSSVGLYLGHGGRYGNSNITVSIRKTIEGEDLTSISYQPEDIVYFMPSWWHEFHIFDFPDIQVKPGDRYFIVVTSDTPDQNAEDSIMYQPNNIYSNGFRWFGVIRGGAVKRWYDRPEEDIIFATFGADGPIKIYSDASYSGKVGDPIQFYCSARDGIPPYTWYWDFGDGQSSQHQNPTHAYQNEGSYNVVLHVTDSEGNTCQKTIQVVASRPPEKPTLSGPRRVWNYMEYEYTATATDPDGDTVSYIFDWGDGTRTKWSDGTATHRWGLTDPVLVNYSSGVVRVKAVDQYGIESEWSEPLPLRTPKICSSNLWTFLWIFFYLTPQILV